jgi:hypothetical protein
MHVMNKHRTKLTRTDIRIYNRLRVDARLTEIDEPWEVELEPGELRRRLCRWWIAVTCFRLPALPMSQRWSSISRRRCNHQWREEGEGRSREGWDAKGQVRRESGQWRDLWCVSYAQARCHFALSNVCPVENGWINRASWANILPPLSGQ